MREQDNCFLIPFCGCSMLTKPAKIAYIIMFFAIIVFIGSTIGLHMVSVAWQKWVLLIAHHGSEGALVGGICDVIAVQNVYRAARDNYNPLIKSTSRLVVQDFIQIQDVIEKGTSVRDWIGKKENQDFLLQQIDKALPNKEKLQEDLEVFWTEKIEEKVIIWILDTDLVSFLFGSEEEVIDVDAQGETEIETDTEQQELKESTYREDHRTANEEVEAKDQKYLESKKDELISIDSHVDHPNVQNGFFNTKLMKNVFADELEQIADNQDLADDFVVQVHSLAEALTLSDMGIPSDPAQLKLLANDLWTEWSSLQDSGRVKNVIAQTAISSIVPWLAPKVETTTIADILKPTLQPKQVQMVLHRFATRIREEANVQATTKQESTSIDEEPDVTITPSNTVQMQDLTKALLGYGRAFAEAWQNMPQTRRRQVVVEIVSFLKSSMITSMIEGVWMLREKLVHPQNLLSQSWIEEVLKRFEDEIKNNSQNIEKRSITALTSQLENYGPDKFTALLQSKTQERLDWIKVNGTGFGFLIGGCAGLLTLLFEHFMKI